MLHSRYISIQTIEGIGTHAIYKARADVNTIIESCGYTPVTLGSRSRVGFFRVLKRYYDIYSLKFKLHKGDNVFFQFPWIHNNKPEFYANLFKNGAEIQCIIHDLDSLRGIERKDHNELRDLSHFHSIIAHTPAMKQFLVEKGIEEQKIKILNIFPYLTKAPKIDLVKYDKPTIVFAGNLSKSLFINKLNEIASTDLRFNIYGKGMEHFPTAEFIKYKGVFSPDYPVVEGNWGLVWDGAQLETCEGLYGEYLRFNSSHKISLYLALGIPVIIWSGSSLKHFIESNHLGIVVNSLTELSATINHLSDEQMANIRAGVSRFVPIIRSGEMLKNLVTPAL